MKTDDIQTPAIEAFNLTKVYGSGNTEVVAMEDVSLGVARFGCFMAAGGLEPAFQALLAQMAPPEERGTLFGIASGLRMTGILLAALSGGFVIYFLGTRAIFVVAALLMLTLLPLLYWSTKYRPQTPAKAS